MHALTCLRQLLQLEKRKPYRTWMGTTYGRRTLGVKLTSSQIADPHKELSTQQTSDFLANFDDDDDNFPAYDAEFEQILTQVEQQSTTTQVAVRRFASPKGKSAIKAAKHSSILVRSNKLVC